MKKFKFSLLAVSACVLFASCDGSLSGGDEKPGEGTGDGPGGEIPIQEYKKYVQSIQLDYKDYMGKTVHQSKTFAYDADKRITSIHESMSGNMYEKDNYDETYMFDYDKSGDIIVRSKTGDYEVVMSFDDTRRIKRFEEKIAPDMQSEERSTMWMSYDDRGYLSEALSSDGDKVTFKYTDGLLSGTGYYDKADDYSEDYHFPHFSTMYANKYPNDKINIDMNLMVISEDLGGFDYDPLFAVMPLRMCGNVFDYFVEVTEGLNSDEEVPDIFDLSWCTVPGNVVHRETKRVGVFIPESGIKVQWEFDGEGCPVSANLEYEYHEYKGEYDIVVGHDVEGQAVFGQDEEGNPIIKNIYSHTITETVYTDTGKKWNCPMTYTITYCK